MGRKPTDSDDEILVSHDWDEIRRFMWDFVGIVRQARLQRARSRTRHSRGSRDYYIKHRVTNDNLELRNLALVAELIINRLCRDKRVAACTSRLIFLTLWLTPKTRSSRLKPLTLRNRLIRKSQKANATG